MASILPKEETIIDPLYEPLKLNRYELCPHLTMLSNVSHLKYGFSPYLLFDVEGWKEVVEVINRTKNGKEIDCKDFIDGLKEYLGELEILPGVANADRNDLYVTLKKERDEIKEEYKIIKSGYREILNKFLYGYLFSYDGVSDKDVILETLMDDPNIDWKKHAENQEINNSKTIPIYDSSNGERWANITIDESEKKAILKISGGRTHNLKVKEENGKLNIYLNDSNKFKENFEKIAHLFRLDYPIKVKCPERDEKQVTEQFMCEEGKIYSMKEALLRTFELRRAKWLQMSGSLHIVHRAATHTRLSHQIGSMIAGVNALREIDVYPRGSMSMSLGEYLLMSGELHEFLMANFLHDIGHSPLSHVLEPNPFIELDHEEITRNLIFGKAVKGEGEGGMDWYAVERYLLRMKTIKDFEHRFFENRYDPIYNVGKEEWNEKERRDEFLNYLGKNDEIVESEIVTVNGVLENFGVDTERVIEILSGKMFCRACKKLSKIEIEGDTVKCGRCGEDTGIEKEKFYDTQFLNKLIESEVDLDRMDHVKRDSVVCGLSLISFRLLELLGSMSVVLPNSNAYKEIHNMENKKPCILISEDGLLYVMDLLTARKSVFKDVLYSDENNWINGVVNQITALAVRYLPHLMNMLPFITDQVLMHFYTNDLFLGTQIEKLNKLFHGKMSYSGYGTPMRYKLNDGVIITNDDLKGMYEAVEAINIKPEYEMVEPAVVFYTNIKETRCPVCSERKLKKIVNKSVYYECVNCKSKIKEIDKKWEITIAKEENKEIYFVKNKDYDIEVILKEDNGNVVICEGEPKPKKEKWDDIFIYGKKFEKNYHPFQKLADKNYEEITIERFPDRPSESDVKNLLYVWINDFVISKKFRGEIKVAMGEVFTDKKQFDERFVNLNTLYWRGNQK